MLKSQIGEKNSEKEEKQKLAHKVLWKKLKSCMPEEIEQLERVLEEYNKNPLSKETANQLVAIDKMIVSKFVDEYEEKYQSKLKDYFNSVSKKEALLDFYFVNYISGIYIIHRLLNVHIDIYNFTRKYILRSQADPRPFTQYNYNHELIKAYRKSLLEFQLKLHLNYIDREDEIIKKNVD